MHSSASTAPHPCPVPPGELGQRGWGERGCFKSPPTPAMEWEVKKLLTSPTKEGRQQIDAAFAVGIASICWWGSDLLNSVDPLRAECSNQP